MRHLRQGDFSLLAPAFASAGSAEPRVLQVLRSGGFDAHPDALAEALTCAAFLGALGVLDHLLRLGVPPEGGAATGLNALHRAANRGELGAVRRLLAAGAALDTRTGVPPREHNQCLVWLEGIDDFFFVRRGESSPLVAVNRR